MNRVAKICLAVAGLIMFTFFAVQTCIVFGICKPSLFLAQFGYGCVIAFMPPFFYVVYDFMRTTKLKEANIDLQLAAIDKKGEPFGFTGADSVPFSGHLVGEDYIIAGNMLSNPSVLSAMGDCINKSYSSEAEKMLAILQAGQRAGGDKRGIQSAAMLILDPEKPPLDLRVDYDENPIFALEELWKRSQRPPYSSWLDEVPILSDKYRSDMPQKNTET